jgi:hypothetical protein
MTPEHRASASSLGERRDRVVSRAKDYARQATKSRWSRRRRAQRREETAKEEVETRRTLPADHARRFPVTLGLEGL